MNENIKAIITIFLSIISMCIGIIAYALDFGLNWWISLIVAICFIVLGNLLIVSYYKKYKSLFKLSITAWIIFVFIAVGYAICFFNNWLIYFEDPDTIKQIILDSGIWGILIFFLLQVFQVLIGFIPSMVTTLVGVAIYGPLVASLISIVAITLGSIIVFFIGRYLGRKVVVWIAGEAQTKKYCDLLNEKGKYLLILMLLFPIFPDDMLCLIAGITSMTFRFYILTILLTRPISIFVTAYFGSGQLIPYSGWGLYAWPGFIVLLFVAFILCWKYQDKFEKYFISKFDKIKNRVGKKNNNNNKEKDK